MFSFIIIFFFYVMHYLFFHPSYNLYRGHLPFYITYYGMISLLEIGRNKCYGFPKEQSLLTVLGILYMCLNWTCLI